MAKTINSFTQSVIDLTNSVNNVLSSMSAINDSMTTQQESVSILLNGTDDLGDPSTYMYKIPSYNYILDKLSRISNTVDTFVSGAGVVLLNDGTYREVITIPIAKAPKPITAVETPTTFKSRSNWFFESMMFPQLYTEFDLKNKIDDRSDRVTVRRIIFDNFDEEETQWFRDNFVGKMYSFETVLNILTSNKKKYWIDEEVQNLPINPNPYTGKFLIVDKQTIEGFDWFFLDTLNFSVTSDITVPKNIELKIGDELRYNDTLYRIADIELTQKRVKLTSLVGSGHPTINNYFNIYTSPFQQKIVSIPVGYNECNIIFFKGVNDDFNILGDEWGDSVCFFSNDLILNGFNTSFEEYYETNVLDFGKQLEGQAKEKFIPAYYGIQPNAPTITAEYFGVNQINTQLNGALDTDVIKNTQSQIESTKSIITSLKSTISQQKAQLVEQTDPATRADLTSKITANINDLNKQTVEYQSLVRSLSTIAYENSAVMADPKYRVRGFFPIPDPVGIPPQEIIQFEYAYRYLKLDNTGVTLNTYEYTDPSTGQIVRGTFTDWTIVQTPIKIKTYDVQTDTYKWLEENTADGNVVNINSVDIPIRKGEKVELKIRSISEAGWPLNPLKSEWSNTVIIEYPSNLEGSDTVLNIIADANADQQAIKLEETLSSTGVITHLNDSIPNPNSGSGTYFKHQAINISFDQQVKDIDGNVVSVKTSDVQSQLQNISPHTFVTITKPPGATSAYLQLTGTLQQFLQAIVNADPSIYEEFDDLINT